MKEVFKYLREIERQIKGSGGVLILLDFDGVISAIAPTPDKAFLSYKNREVLKLCNRAYPVAIITGRTLRDIKEKIGVKCPLYIASHGLEWEADGKYHLKLVPKKISQAIELAKQKIKPLGKKYPGMIFEEKIFMFAVHYRMINLKLVGAFKREAGAILKSIGNNNLRIDHNKKTFEIRPEIGWDKGNSAIFAEKYFKKKIKRKFLTVYIGDGLTDEDAFKALKNGITIRVRPKKGSRAKYYFKSRREVDEFLLWLSTLRSIITL